MATITSANTSINKDKLPALFNLVQKKVGWEKDSNHLDMGCGKYPKIISNFLKKLSVGYIGVDPYNRTEMENALAWDLVEVMEGVHTASLSNVLNVIQSEESRKYLIKKAWENLRIGGSLFITVYEGNRSGIGKVTKNDCWQENRKTDDYVLEIAKVFGKENVKRSGKLIIAIKN